MVSAEKKDETKKPDASKDEKNKKKEETKDTELTEEDKRLQDELNLYVTRIQDDDAKLHHPALENLRKEIRASTTSMTSVPKPLKFLRTHFETIKEVQDKMTNAENKKLCADIVSVLALTMGSGRDCLKYRIKGSQEPIGSWGHEYVRHLATELADEYRENSKLDKEYSNLVLDVCRHHVSHNAEAEAVDLLMELEQLDSLPEFVDEHTQPRVCLYLLSCVPYVPDPENMDLLKICLTLYLKFGKRMEALKTALIINDRKRILDTFYECKDPLEKKQMAIILGRQQVFIDVPPDLPKADDLTELVSNTNLATYFLQLARELDIMDPKTPEDVYKSHLEPSRPYGGTAQVDSARQNLANTFVNALVNCGFGVDKLVTEDANKWFYKNKEHGMMSAAASQGLIYRWDIDNGLTMIDKYLYANEDFIKAGSLLAIGIISSGVQHECDPAAALLLDYIQHEKSIHRIGSILGLGLAYANSSRESVREQVIPGLQEVLTDAKATPEVMGITGLALGLICVGTGGVNADVAMQIWGALEAQSDLTDPSFRYLALAIGLIYLGRQEEVEVVLESLHALPSPFKGMAVTLVEACAYAGTGNVLKVQKLLHVCSETLQKEDKDKDKKEGDKKGNSTTSSKQQDLPEGWLEQAVAVLGISLIASAEDVGNQMSFRMFGNLLRYGEVWIRRTVPLALALSSASNPQLNILETLSKFSHDADTETAYNAIFAMGIVGAGTNNARLGAMLRQLAGYHQRDPLSLFLVRIAQGLVHMGKGTLTLHPFHFDRSLLCLPSLAALLVTMFAFFDVKNTILGRQHYLLYNLVPAIQPRMLITFEEDDDELKQINVSVRVGQAVDVVGQAGKPKTITGFQTHTTPVLLAHGERAELATEEYLSVSPVLEGFVILKKNPDYEKE